MAIAGLPLTCREQEGVGERELESTGPSPEEGSAQGTKYPKRSSQKQHKIQVTELQVLCAGFEQGLCICPGELAGE